MERNRKTGEGAVLMKRLLNVIAGIVLCVLVCNKVVKYFDGDSNYDVAQTYHNFQGVFGLRFGDAMSEEFSRYGKYEGMDVYLVRPPSPAYGFDRYAVLVRPNESRILLIRAEKDFSSRAELKDFVKLLKGEFEKRFRTIARKIEQDDSWAFVFRGPKNGYDKGITLISGYDASIRQWQVQLNAVDGNVIARR